MIIGEYNRNMGIEFTFFQPAFGATNSFIYFLTAILLLCSVISFVKSKFDVLHPSLIYSICLTGCCTLALLYTRAWDLPMNFNSACIIIGMSFLFFVGSILAEFSVNTDKCIIENSTESSHVFFIDWPLWIFFLALLLYFLYLNYVEFLTVASQVTQEQEFTKMLSPVTEGIAYQKIEMSRWSEYRLRFATGMAYLSILAVWLNLTAHQYKELFKWGCFVVLYVPFVVLTGGRQQFMYLIMFGLISFFLVYRKSDIQNSLRKEFMIIGIAVIAFLLCFLGIGIVNGKIGPDANFLKVLVHYAGTNISAFDVYINEMTIPDTTYIGSTTLTRIYGFLYTHGVNVPQFSQYITLFTAFGPVTTNVYTAFYRYINDFGYFGCALVMFLIGFFYTFFYRQLYRHGLKNWMILIYASIAYPIFLMGREERFLNEILTTSEISFIIGLLVLYKFFEFLSERRSRVK